MEPKRYPPVLSVYLKAISLTNSIWKGYLQSVFTVVLEETHLFLCGKYELY